MFGKCNIILSCPVHWLPGSGALARMQEWGVQKNKWFLFKFNRTKSFFWKIWNKSLQSWLISCNLNAMQLLAPNNLFLWSCSFKIFLLASFHSVHMQLITWGWCGDMMRDLWYVFIELNYCSYVLLHHYLHIK